MRVLPALLLLSAYPSQVMAQEVRGTLTLGQALGLALDNNPGFQSAANDQGAADWRLRESVGNFLPAFTTSMGAQYLAPGVPSTGIFTGSDFGIGSTDYYFSNYNLNLSYTISGSSFFLRRLLEHRKNLLTDLLLDELFLEGVRLLANDASSTLNLATENRKLRADDL